MTHLKHLSKRIGSLLLAFAVFLTTFSLMPAQLRASAAAYSFMDGSCTSYHPAEGYIDFSEHLYLAKGGSTSPENLIEIIDSDNVTMNTGDELKFDLSWTWKDIPLPDDEGNKPCYYMDVTDQFKGIELPSGSFDVTDGGVVTCSYKFVEDAGTGKVFALIIINAEILNQQEREGSCLFSCELDLDNAETDNGDGTYSIKFFDKNVIITNTQNAPDVEIKKTAGAIEYDGMDFWQTFTLDVYNYGKTPAENVKITDIVAENGLFLPGSLEIISGGAVVGTPGASTVIAVSNGTAADGVTPAVLPTTDPVYSWVQNPVTVTYRMKLVSDAAKLIKSSTDGTNKAVCDYSNKKVNQQDYKLSAQTYTTTNTPKVNKNGVYDEGTDEITWTVKLTLGDILRYNPSLITSISVADVLTKPDGTPSDVDLSALGLDNLANWTNEGGGVYSFTYTTENASDERLAAGDSRFVNKATVTVNGEPFTGTSGGVSVGSNTVDYVDKSGVYNGNGTITWTVSVELPDPALPNLKINDYHEGTAAHTNDYSSIFMRFGGTVYSLANEGTAYGGWWGNFENGSEVIGRLDNCGDAYYNIAINSTFAASHAGETIEIVYNSVIPEDSAEVLFKNKAVLYSNSTLLHEDPAQVKTHPFSLKKTGADKSGYSDYNGNLDGKNAADYYYPVEWNVELTISDTSAAAGDVITFTDVLPEGMKFLPINDWTGGTSTKGVQIFYGENNRWTGSGRCFVMPAITAAGGREQISLEITVTGEMLFDLAANPDHRIYLTYYTCMTDDEASDFVLGGVKKAYRNNATAQLSGSGESDSATAKVELTPSTGSVLDKTIVASNPTGSYYEKIDYSIEVNTAKLKLNNGQPFVLYDQLGTYLRVPKENIKVVNRSTGADVTAEMTIAIDDNNLISISSFADKTHYTVTYSAFVDYIGISAPLTEEIIEKRYSNSPYIVTSSQTVAGKKVKLNESSFRTSQTFSFTKPFVIRGTKTWANVSGAAPTDITVKIIRTNLDTLAQETLTVSDVIVNKSGYDWSYRIPKDDSAEQILYLYKEGTPYKYTIAEVAIDGYVISYSGSTEITGTSMTLPSGGLAGEYLLDITNTYEGSENGSVKLTKKFGGTVLNAASPLLAATKFAVYKSYSGGVLSDMVSGSEKPLSWDAVTETAFYELSGLEKKDEGGNDIVYYLAETAAPLGYCKDNTVYKVTFTGTGGAAEYTNLTTAEKTAALTVTNAKIADVKLTKRFNNAAPQTGFDASGFVFTLKGTGAVSDIVLTASPDASGIVLFSGAKLRAGVYTITEHAAAGWVSDTAAVTVTVADDGSVSYKVGAADVPSVVINNVKAQSAKITKQYAGIDLAASAAELRNMLLLGTRFAIYSDAACTVQVGAERAPAWSGAKAYVEFGGLSVSAAADAVYYIKETKSPDGFMISGKVIKCVISHVDGSVKYYDNATNALLSDPVCVNSMVGNIEITKTYSDDPASKSALYAATQFTLYDSTDHALKTVTVGIDGKAVFKNITDVTLDPAAVYYIRETAAPAGYAKSANTIKVTFTDGAARYTVIDKDGVVISADQSSVSCENRRIAEPVITLVKVFDGVTTLAEAQALAANTEFTLYTQLLADGSDVDQTSAVSGMEAVHPVWSAANKRLELTFTGANIRTNSVYFIKETAADSNYILSDRIIRCAVQNDGTVIYSDAKNASDIGTTELPKLINSKKDAITIIKEYHLIGSIIDHSEIADGTVFGIYDTPACDNTAIATANAIIVPGIGNDRAQVVFSTSALADGEYYIKEIAVGTDNPSNPQPVYYAVSDAVVKVKLESGRIRYWDEAAGEYTTEPPVVVNTKLFDISIKKAYDITVTHDLIPSLSAAQFSLYDGAGTLIATKNVVYDGGFEVTFTGLASGYYYIKETAAPFGFKKSDKVIGVSIAPTGEVTYKENSSIGDTDFSAATTVIPTVLNSSIKIELLKTFDGAAGNADLAAQTIYGLYSAPACDAGSLIQQKTLRFENGKATVTFTGISAASAQFYVKEISTDSRYAIDQTVHTVTVDENGAVTYAGGAFCAEADNKLIDKLSFEKSFEGTDAPAELTALAAATQFTLYNSADNVLETVTAAYVSPKVMVSFGTGLERGKTYYIRETATDTDKYTVLDTVFVVKTDSAGNVLIKTADQSDALLSAVFPTVVNKKKVSAQPVKVAKTYEGADTLSAAELEALAGSTIFAIYSAATCAESVKIAQTALTVNGTGGAAEFTGLDAGRVYYIREKQAPEGYDLNETVFVAAIAADGTVMYKRYSDDDSAFAASFPACENLKTAVTDDIALTKTYEGASELSDAEMSALAAATQFTLYSNSACTYAVAYASPVWDSASKTAKVTFTSADNAAITFGATLYMKETKSPDGYEKSADIYVVHIKDDGRAEYRLLTEAAFSDSLPVCENKKTAAPSAMPIVIGKTYQNSDKFTAEELIRLAQATRFALYADAGCTQLLEERALIRTNSGRIGVEFNGLEAGTVYYFKEVSAPAGYDVCEDIFTAEIAEDGTVRYRINGGALRPEITVLNKETADNPTPPTPRPPRPHKPTTTSVTTTTTTTTTASTPTTAETTATEATTTATSDVTDVPDEPDKPSETTAASSADEPETSEEITPDEPADGTEDAPDEPTDGTEDAPDEPDGGSDGNDSDNPYTQAKEPVLPVVAATISFTTAAIVAQKRKKK